MTVLCDCFIQQVSFTSLLTCLSIDNLISVFASVLLERKIIFVAQHLRFVVVRFIVAVRELVVSNK